MALTYHVAGPALLKIGASGDSAGSLTSLDYTVNGVDITAEAHFEQIHSDDNGGEAGPPAELNYLGERCIVRAELVQWDETEANKIRARLRGSTAGTPAAPGTLVFANGYEFRLLISTTTEPLNFTRAVPRGAQTINKGTRHSRLIVEFECYKAAAGTLYNNSTA